MNFMKNFTMPLVALSALILLSLSPIMAMEKPLQYEEIYPSYQDLQLEDLFPELSSHLSNSDDSDNNSKGQLDKEIDPRPYKCVIYGCNKAYSAPRYLNRHMNMYHPAQEIYDEEYSDRVIDVVGDSTNDARCQGNIDVFGFDTSDDL